MRTIKREELKKLDEGLWERAARMLSDGLWVAVYQNRSVRSYKFGTYRLVSFSPGPEGPPPRIPGSPAAKDCVVHPLAPEMDYELLGVCR